MTKVEISIDYPDGYCSEGNMRATMTTAGYELNLEEILRMVASALRGVGYCFDGHLEVVYEEGIDDATTSDRKISKSEARRREHFKQS